MMPINSPNLLFLPYYIKRMKLTFEKHVKISGSSLSREDPALFPAAAACLKSTSGGSHLAASLTNCLVCLVPRFLFLFLNYSPLEKWFFVSHVLSPSRRRLTGSICILSSLMAPFMTRLAILPPEVFSNLDLWPGPRTFFKQRKQCFI